MTYYELIQNIKALAFNQPNIKSFVRSFDDLNREDMMYGAVICQDQTHQRNGQFMSYTFYIGVADRENDAKDNIDFNYSTGINVLNNMVNTIANDAHIVDLSFSNIVCLEQKFLAECTVVYGTITITLPVSDCYTNYNLFGDFNNDFNDDYNN